MVCCVQGLSTAVIKSKGTSINSCIKDLEKYLLTVFSTDIRVLDAENPPAVVRHLSTMPTKEISWRNYRSYLQADTVEMLPSTGDDADKGGNNTCTVRLSGYLRGSPLYLHSLGHVPGVSTGSISHVEVHTNGGPLRALSRRGNSSAGGGGVVILEVDGSLQDPMTTMALGDGLQGEQTWPTDDELADGVEGERRNVPQNVSNYLSPHTYHYHYHLTRSHSTLTPDPGRHEQLPGRLVPRRGW